ncbi:MAG TPA: type II secretion system minor pseudopilin GspK [Usitatibacter sp.]|nr:type II secretion system minor pseudopilin GspK [Usitatibacter sp.]
MRRQRGVAAITAILIVAVAASTAALMLSQQSAMIDQTLMVSSRAQADLYAQAGLDWARGVLAEDARRSKDVDSLDEGWAQPIAALPVDRAVIAGAISDEQGKVNLNNLDRDGQRSEEDLRIFRTLLGSLGVAPELAEAVLDWIDRDSDLAGSAGAENSYYLALARPYRAPNAPMVQVEELYRVRGFDAATVAKVKPYVTALPGRAALNVNTATDEVLGAFLGLTREKATAMVTERRTKPFRTKQEFIDRARRDGVESIRGDFDVKSAFYSVRIQVSQDEVQLASEALVRRGDNATTAIIWRRPLY